MSVICQFDKTEHESIEALHKHLRRFKIKQETYHMEYNPRFDMLTGERIPFKSYEQYITQEFKDKNSLKKWLKLNPDKGPKWAIEWLRRRKEEKGLIYAPSQAELRSLFCPSMPYYDSIGGYYKIAESLGFKTRYTDEKPVFTPLPADAAIIQDTREQKALILGVKTTCHKVDEGDYALAAPHDQGVYIERKSLTDFISSLSARKVKKKGGGEDSALDRIERELVRAADKGHYIVMMVESDINTALGFDHLPHIKQRTKVSSSYIFKNLRDLLVKYPLSFQVVFVNGRVDAAQKLVKIFQLGNQVRRIDLQNALEKEIL